MDKDESRMLELGMRKAGAGAAGGLADSPLARGADDRKTRFGTRSEWADFADFAKERKGKDHAYERAKAEKAMAESGDGWRPGAHDEALDSLLDRFDDDDDPIVMRELAPTPEVTFDVADMPEAPPDGRPLLFGPPPGGTPSSAATTYSVATHPSCPTTVSLTGYGLGLPGLATTLNGDGAAAGREITAALSVSFY